VLRYRNIPKPYVNAEYGYEGRRNQRGHEQNAAWVRQCHWAIAMAGGFATYGDWGKRAGYYIGEPDAGIAATQLKHLRTFFESIGSYELEPVNRRMPGGFCMTDRKPTLLVGYLPEGRATRIDLHGLEGSLVLEWYDTRTGTRRAPIGGAGGAQVPLEPPSLDDWAFTIRSTHAGNGSPKLD
jgi:hypothetical protein